MNHFETTVKILRTQVLYFVGNFYLCLLWGHSWCSWSLSETGLDPTEIAALAGQTLMSAERSP